LIMFFVAIDFIEFSKLKYCFIELMRIFCLLCFSIYEQNDNF
jgi:hypothetical protein